MELEKLFLRIDPTRYHFLKFILEAYDGLCLLSSVPSFPGVVCVRFPKEQAGTLYHLLAPLSSSVKPRYDERELPTARLKPNRPL